MNRMMSKSQIMLIVLQYYVEMKIYGRCEWWIFLRSVVRIVDSGDREEFQSVKLLDIWTIEIIQAWMQMESGPSVLSLRGMRSLWENSLNLLDLKSYGRQWKMIASMLQFHFQVDVRCGFFKLASWHLTEKVARPKSDDYGIDI